MNLKIGSFALALLFSGSIGADQVDPYWMMGQECSKGNKAACSELKERCEDGVPGACFHLSYNIGIQGDDELGLKYLKKACDGGILEACRNIPIIKRYIEGKRQSARL